MSAQPQDVRLRCCPPGQLPAVEGGGLPGSPARWARSPRAIRAPEPAGVAGERGSRGRRPPLLPRWALACGWGEKRPYRGPPGRPVLAALPKEEALEAQGSGDRTADFPPLPPALPPAPPQPPPPPPPPRPALSRETSARQLPRFLAAPRSGLLFIGAAANQRAALPRPAPRPITAPWGRRRLLGGARLFSWWLALQGLLARSPRRRFFSGFGDVPDALGAG